MTWKKGQSGNPRGRPRKNAEVERLCQEALTNPDGSNFAVQQLRRIALEAELDRDRIKAIELLTAYAYGKPRQRTEVSGPDGGPIQLVDPNDYTDEQLAGMLKGGGDE